MIHPPPPGYRRFVIDDVRATDEMLTLAYGGHIFGGITRCLLADGVENAIRPGTEVFVRYHDPRSGAPGQVAHMIIRHDCAEGWAEVYCDGV